PPSATKNATTSRSLSSCACGNTPCGEYSSLNRRLWDPSESCSDGFSDICFATDGLRSRYSIRLPARRCHFRSTTLRCTILPPEPFQFSAAPWLPSFRRARLRACIRLKLSGARLDRDRPPGCGLGTPRSGRYFSYPGRWHRFERGER